MVHIIKVGVDYRFTPLEVREKLTFSKTEVQHAMIMLNKEKHVLENMIISTCNRTEIFVVVNDVDAGQRDVILFLMKWFQLDEWEFVDDLQISSDDLAIQHAFRLAVGLESMVLGETQILGQFRDAFLSAQHLNTTGKLFNELFKRVVTFAKRAHNETGIGERAMSVSYIAVELIRNMLGDLREKHAVILGAGDMGELSLRHLKSHNVSHMTVINRSFDKAKRLADNYDVSAGALEELSQSLIGADILMSSTGASGVVLTKEQMSLVQEARNHRPLYLIDIAVPRDIEESVGELHNIYLYDMDSLQHVADENMEKRQEAAKVIASQLDDELTSFKAWVNMLDVVPLIKVLRDKSLDIQERTLESIYRKIPDLDERETKVLKKHTKSIIHQLLELPLEQIKLMGMNKQSDEAKDMFATIFGIEETIDKDESQRKLSNVKHD